jgi:predicted ester cyclase
MSNARNIVDRFYELFGAGKIADATELFDPACITVMPGAGALSQSEHEAVGFAFKAAFPDAAMHAEQTVESGDEIVVLGRFRGTHTGDLVSGNGTIPASGNDLDLRYMDYFKVTGDKITDHQVVFDQMELLGQIGALPAPA